MYTEKVLHFFNLVANIFSSQLCKKGISVHVLQYSTVLVPVFFLVTVIKKHCSFQVCTKSAPLSRTIVVQYEAMLQKGGYVLSQD